MRGRPWCRRGWRCVAGPIVGALAGCFADPPVAEGPDHARKLLHDLEAADYPRWPRTPKYAERRPALGPHGAWVDVYLDPILDAGRTGDPIDAWPEGSAVVCEGFDDETDVEPSIVSLMLKQDGAWVFAQLDAVETIAYGRPGVCISCHAFGDDYLRTVRLPRP